MQHCPPTPRLAACRQMKLWTFLLLAGVASATTLRTAADRKLLITDPRNRAYKPIYLADDALFQLVQRGEVYIDGQATYSNKFFDDLKLAGVTTVGAVYPSLIGANMNAIEMYSSSRGCLQIVNDPTSAIPGATRNLLVPDKDKPSKVLVHFVTGNDKCVEIEVDSHVFKDDAVVKEHGFISGPCE